ncbi:MAG: ACP S-malonyltransferase [Calditrichia bacterium]
MAQKVSFMFPGQGSQYVGMTSDILEVSGFARKTFKKASEILGEDLREICINGPEEKLKQTKYTQPALFTHSFIVTTLLKERGLEPDGVAGHSLGEYSALAAAGAFDFEEGFTLVKIRGELMQKSGEVHPGTMAAIIGMTAEQVEEVCKEAESTGIVQPANFNCPGQIVISGDVNAVRKAIQIAKDKGARLARELVVSGAFHSPLMKEAIEGLSKAIDEANINDISVPLYANVTGKPVTKASEIKELLKQQLLSPVRWEDSMRNMINDGYNFFLEVGPGNVLQGLLKRIDRNMDFFGVDRLSDLEQLEI